MNWWARGPIVGSQGDSCPAETTEHTQISKFGEESLFILHANFNEFVFLKRKNVKTTTRTNSKNWKEIIKNTNN
jgi:hypothetical protein